MKNIENKSTFVSGLFGRIYQKYDYLNTVMTAGRHHSWRKLAVKLGLPYKKGVAVDLATGTGDFSFELLNYESIDEVISLDITPEMLDIALDKARQKNMDQNVTWLVGDSHFLPFNNDSFVCATVGFGVRNFEDVPLAMSVIARVLKPGGKVVILEIVKPSNIIMSKIFFMYFRKITPLLGTLLARDRAAYTYLPDSVGNFMTSDELGNIMDQSGLKNVQIKKFALGSMAILIGEK